MLRFHHLAITTADQDKATPFYDKVFGLLGYTRRHTSDRLCTWVGPGPELLLYSAEGEDTTPHTHGRPGWQHAALAVDERDTVDAVHAAVVEGGWTVVHAPGEYDYAPGYYATFVVDPDGIRWEIAPTSLPRHTEPGRTRPLPARRQRHSA